MRKFLIFFVVLTSLCFGEILSPENAFKMQITGEKTQGINVDFDLSKDVYLYTDKIKISIDDKDITKYLNMPEHKNHDGYDIYKGKTELFIPSGLISNFSNLDKFRLTLNYQGCSYSGFCYQPIQKDYNVTFDSNKAEFAPLKPVIKDRKTEISEQDKIAQSFNKEGKFIAIITFFGYGLLLSLTPCIFPMIPILSSIIVAKSGTNTSIKKGFFISFVYVFFMSLAYAIAGVLASFFGASVQGLLQIPAIIIAFSVIFILLALSMFGFYNIELPKRLQNYINSKEKASSGIFGVAVMGFLSALVVGPCVAAPLAGALLYIANSGDALFGGLALFIMSFGMGVPLLLIGLGSGKILPKPGFWMEEIKRIFGFLMIIMAVWMGGRVLSEDITNMLYGVVGLFFAVYLGAFNEAANGGQKFLKAFGLLVFTVSIVLIVNFSISKFGSNLSFASSSASSKNIDLEFTHVSNLDELNSVIRTSQKPVMIDFWASWCANCKELDEITFKNSDVINKLKSFTLVKIDVTNNTENDVELMKKFKIFGPPALIFYNNNEELKDKQIVGYIEPQKFLEHIKSI